MKASEANALVAVLKAAYPRQELGEDTVGLYERALADVPAAAGRAAVEQHIATSRWWPTIAELRELVAETRLSLPTAEAALAEVRKALQGYGAHEVPPWSCPEVAEAVGVIGWSNWCLSDHPASTRARFLEAYQTVRRRSLEQAQRTGLQLLPGESRPQLGGRHA